MSLALRHRLVVCAAMLAVGGCGGTRNHVVATTPDQLACTTDADCALTVLACGGCDVAVARSAIPALQDERQRMCRHWQRVEVLCPPPERAVCRAQRCATEPDRP